MNTPIRVLIVDDRDAPRTTLKSTLTGYDCAFSEAATGEEALALMSAKEFDVSFIDLRLPDMTGLEVLAAARERNYAIGLPVILTGDPKLSTPEDAGKLGAKYLTKPIIRAQIRTTIQEAVPGAVAKAPPIVVPERIESIAAASDAAAEPRKLPRLLVLDDNPDWLDIMKKVLERGFELQLTTSPAEAIGMAAHDSYDLVILDMKLPEISGLDVLKDMREMSPDLRAVILTDYDDLTLATESGRRGALDYVKKDRSTLFDRISDILRKNPRMTRIFFSYDHRDKDEVTDYYWKLTKRGFLPWMDDRDIKGGKDWKLTIEEAIDRADRFIYFLSRHSFNRAGDMRVEINQALRRQETLPKNSTFFIPACLEQCGIEKDIRQFQVVPLFKPDGFAKLLEALTTD